MDRTFGRAFCFALLAYAVSGRSTSSIPHVVVPGVDRFLEPAGVDVVIDLAKSEGSHSIASDLFGIFFEEINHAGEGGIYAELVNDRSFDGLAYETGFLDAEVEKAELPYPLPPRRLGMNPISWHAQPGTQIGLTKEKPLNPGNKIALNLSASSGEAAVFNDGFWGITLNAGHLYHLTIYLQAAAGEEAAVDISLESSSGEAVYAFERFEGVPDEWTKYAAILTSSGTDAAARLAIRTGNSVLVDFVSLFPEANGPEGSITPFRQDILALLKELRPRTVRLPGGCYVEGAKLANSFWWRPSVGPVVERPGHFNGPWGYWSTDGLGMFEYMQMAEELGAEAVWVFNNGVAHEDSMPTSEIGPFVEDTLNSLEFVLGDADSEFGKLRASMGRKEPWRLNYVAIGNEDCGKPYYTSNYIVFFDAIQAKYPEMRLIANCYMGTEAPTDIWDWHWYTTSPGMFAVRTAFDGPELRTQNGSIYASEYAVFDWGIETSPGGNLQGAVAEAAFMTGLERNSDVAVMAAFAPLLVNANHHHTCPSNLIVFDGNQSVRTPSYHVQSLFSQYQGTKYVATSLEGVNEATVAASASCLNADCNVVSCKIVNFRESPRPVRLSLKGAAGVAKNATVVVLTSSDPLDSNTLQQPDKVVPITSKVNFSADPHFKLEPWSFYVINLELAGPAEEDLAWHES